MAIHIEQKVICEVVGSQDQISTCYGGFNRINFLPRGNFHVSPIVMEDERKLKFQKNLLLDEKLYF